MGHRVHRWALACAGVGCVAAALLFGSPSRAGECTLAPFLVLSELRVPSYTGGGTYDQPLALVWQQRLEIVDSSGCNGDCPSNSSLGDTECGDLVTTPVDVSEVVEGLTLMEFNAYTARLLASGKWEYRADVLLEKPTDEFAAKFAYSNISFGHREVFDVTSAASGTRPFRVRLRESGVIPAGPQGCPGFFRPIPSRNNRTLRILVQNQGLLVNETLGGVSGTTPDRAVVLSVPENPQVEREILEWDFDLEVPTNAVVFVDLLYDFVGGTFQSPVTDFVTGQTCDVTLVQSQWIEPDGGIQLFFSPDPALTVVSRSGITYAPVPEPGAFASALVGFGALARCRRRRRTGREGLGQVA